MNEIILGGLQNPITAAGLGKFDRTEIAEVLIASLIAGTSYVEKIEAEAPLSVKYDVAAWTAKKRDADAARIWRALEVGPEPDDIKNRNLPFKAARSRDRMLLSLTARKLDDAHRLIRKNRADFNVSPATAAIGASGRDRKKLLEAIRIVEKFHKLGGIRELTRSKSWESLNYSGLNSTWKSWFYITLMTVYMANWEIYKTPGTKEATIGKISKIVVNRPGWNDDLFSSIKLQEIIRTHYSIAPFVSTLYLIVLKESSGFQYTSDIIAPSKIPTLRKLIIIIRKNIPIFISTAKSIQNNLPDKIGIKRFPINHDLSNVTVLLPNFSGHLPAPIQLPTLTELERAKMTAPLRTRDLAPTEVRRVPKRGRKPKQPKIA